MSGGSGSSATRRLGGGGQGGALLLFNISRSRLTRTDETFSTTPLCASADIEEDSTTWTVKKQNRRDEEKVTQMSGASKSEIC